MPLRKASQDRERWWTWGGVLPRVLLAIVDALPEGGASPIAPEPAITINTEGVSEEPFDSAARSLGITVEELLSLPNQLVIDVNQDDSHYVLTRVYYWKNGDDGVVAEFGNNSQAFSIDIDLVNNTVNAETLII